MVFTYSECIKKYGSDYLIKKAIKEGELFQKAKGLYSDQPHCSEIELLTVKYPRAVYTGFSAYYYHNLTDVIPDKHYLATRRTDSRIKEADVKQSFINEELFELGKTTIEYDGISINIYSRERLLVDLIRLKSKIPFDYYKEVINNYRRIADELDYFHMEDCACGLKNGNKIMQRIQLEVL